MLMPKNRKEGKGRAGRERERWREGRWKAGRKQATDDGRTARMGADEGSLNQCGRRTDDGVRGDVRS